MGSIVWIASYPRSGNTWTRTFLHNLLATLQGRSHEQDINDMSALTTWDVYPVWWKAHLPQGLEKAGNAEAALVRPKVQAEIAAAAKGIVFVKTHNALVLSHKVPAINLAVTSGAVYIVRDPLDVVISYAKHFGLALDKAVRQLCDPGLETRNHPNGAFEVYGAWRENVLSWTRKPNRTLYIMRYEDMLADPEKTFGALARHLTLRPTAAQLSDAIERSSFGRLKEQEQSAGFRERPRKSDAFFRVGTAGQWREVLTERQVAAIVKANREQMARFGYLPPDF